jgi:hypothetical protein
LNPTSLVQGISRQGWGISLQGSGISRQGSGWASTVQKGDVKNKVESGN